MASAAGSYYYSPYYQPAPYHYNNYNYSAQQQRGWLSSVPVVLFLATVTLLAATTLISWCESAVESLVYQLRGFLILSPVLVVVAVQLWVASGGGGGLVSLFSELVTGDQDQMGQYHYPYYQYHGGAGSTSPWGVALALALVLFLVSYQSSIW